MIEVSSFEQKWSFLKDETVYIACSGGVDSIVLSEIIKMFCPKIKLLHINYNLRGAESIDDENFVREYAQKNQLSLEVKSIDTKQILAQNKSNLQDLARKIRYDWFEEKIESENAYILLAHHQDDQIETFFQHLARKSGILGLACMLEKHGNYLRPLLTYSKQEIYDFAIQNKIFWREDSSNQTNKYTRNKLRNEFLPFLRTQIPSLNESVLTLIDVFQQNQKEIDLSVKPVIEKMLKEQFLSLAVYQLLTVSQRISILKSLSYAPIQIKEFEKLEKAQKGKFIASEKYKITRETEGFSIKQTRQNRVIPALKIEIVSELPTNYSKNEIFLDESKIQGALNLRFWEIGDRIAPLGMKGTKLISDVITEAKIPNSERKNILVLCDDKTIHWCVGLKIGRLALATETSTSSVPKSEQILRVCLSEF
ncbi:MAG: tRNA lysidine(34) synthetase TilS [Bacteroidota bacterium]